MTARAIGWLLAGAAPLVALALLGCPGGGPVPETDVCRTPATTGSVAALSARHVDSSAALAEGDVLPVTIGGQGSTMIGLELLFEGDDVPGCAAQQTTILRADGSVIDQSSQPISTYERPDGSRVSGELWLFPGFDATAGTEAIVRVESYGATWETTVYLDRRPE